MSRGDADCRLADGERRASTRGRHRRGVTARQVLESGLASSQRRVWLPIQSLELSLVGMARIVEAPVAVPARWGPILAVLAALVAAIPADGAATPLVATAGSAGVRTLYRGPATTAVPGPEGSGRTVASQEPVGSRAQLWRRLREAKEAGIRRPRRATVEEGLFQVEDNYLIPRLAAGWHGFHPVFGGLPTGSGLGLGFRFIDESVGEIYVDPDDPDRLDVAWGAVGSFKGYITSDVEIVYHDIRGSSLGIAGRARYQRFPQEDFFGLGPGSRAEDRASYLVEDFEAGAEVFWERPSWLRVGAGFARLDVNTGPGKDERFPSVEEVFTAAEVPGLEQQPDYWRTSGFVEVDLRDHPLNPRQGGYYAVRTAHYDQRAGDGLDFRSYQVDLQQYFPFFNKHRVVAVRAHTMLTDADSGEAVPFFLQPDLGGNDTLRGFPQRRFRAPNSVLLTAEYRWEAWIGLDMALFVDTGKVFDDRSDIVDLDDYEIAYGLGFRFNTAEGVFLRTDIAKSSEGLKAYFVFDHVF